MGNAYRKKGGHCRDDGALYAGGMGQTNIKEHILHRGLHNAQQQDALPLFLPGNQQLPIHDG